MTSDSPFQIHNATIHNLKKVDSISTGIGFFDHMIQQLVSHAQIGVSVHVSKGGSNCDNRVLVTDQVNRYAQPCELQQVLMSQVGQEIGRELGQLLQSVIPSNSKRDSRFCCPLDEALVECVLEIDLSNTLKEGSLKQFSLPPYGIYPPNKGRSQIGHMMTNPNVELFFQALATTSGMNISLMKIRGDNGHHIVEAAFKAFSRCLRNLIDGTNTTNPDMWCKDTGSSMFLLWGSDSDSYEQSLALNRSATAERKTKETSISIDLKLDGGKRGSQIDMGIDIMNDFYTALANAADISLNVQCEGDLWVDDHHTAEDVSIAVGKCLNEALGTKAGLNRMWNSECCIGGGNYGSSTTVEVIMDLSNRPCLTCNLNFQQEEYIRGFSVEMLHHALESLVINSLMTVHIVDKGNLGKENQSGLDGENLIMATAKAFGQALKQFVAVDPRRAGTIASSKGTLSV